MHHDPSVPVPLRLLLLGLSLISASSVPAEPSPPFLLTWGWGVQDGTAEFQICTSGCQKGAPGTGDGQLYDPVGVAVDAGGYVYVADAANDRIQKFDSSGAFSRTWGWGVEDGSSAFQVCSSDCQAGLSGDGAGQFNSPEGVAVDASGNVYVADTGNHRIQKFNGTGTFLRMWGKGVDDGSLAFQICTSDCQTGLSGSGDGQLNNPEGVAVNTAGRVYVADTENHRIQKFNSGGTFLSKWGTAGSSAGELNTPFGVAIDDARNVYVVDTYNHRIQKFDNKGKFLTTWGSEGSNDGELYFPSGAAVDAAGNLWVADYNNHRIQKFDGAATS